MKLFKKSILGLLLHLPWKGVFDRRWQTLVSGKRPVLNDEGPKLTLREIGGPRRRVRSPLSPIGHERGVWKDLDSRQFVTSALWQCRGASKGMLWAVKYASKGIVLVGMLWADKSQIVDNPDPTKSIELRVSCSPGDRPLQPLAFSQRFRYYNRPPWRPRVVDRTAILGLHL